ncbi:YppG family protein [Virgibacillus byunsanensis]|uniref:YppG family protein n=1 Tax=Virgibacillus byunsanensis TaxID=570945 RepID=A0ABW3LQX8_9BACI
MFPERTPRGPMPILPPGRGRQQVQNPQQPAKQNLLNQFRDQEGNLDLDKITVTAQQMTKIYGQVSPMISPMITKFMKK